MTHTNHRAALLERAEPAASLSASRRSALSSPRRRGGWLARVLLPGREPAPERGGGELAEVRRLQPPGVPPDLRPSLRRHGAGRALPALVVWDEV